MLAKGLGIGQIIYLVCKKYNYRLTETKIVVVIQVIVHLTKITRRVSGYWHERSHVILSRGCDLRLVDNQGKSALRSL